MQSRWQQWAAERGYGIACGHPSVLDHVRAELAARRLAGELSEAVDQRYLSSFQYADDPELPAVKAVVVLAIPRPAHKVVFQWREMPVEVILPPTYVSYRQIGDVIRVEMEADLLGPAQRLVPLQAPLKAVAARLGLVSYGRNNVTYAPGLGSYHQLVGFLTYADLGPLAAPAVEGATVAPECERCRACRKACPTGAIGDDRFLLHAGRCLTLFSETPGPWPDWLPPSAVRCLVGCMACQEVCPLNAGRLRVEALASGFDAAETALLLGEGGGASDPLWEGVKAKLAAVSLDWYEEVVGRNLKALLGGSSAET